MSDRNCKNADCEVYPYYGVAPHICYHKQEGGCGVYFCPDCKRGMPENLEKNKFGAYYKKETQ